MTASPGSDDAFSGAAPRLGRITKRDATLLNGLSNGEPNRLRGAMQLRPEPGRPDAAERLDPRTGALVRLAALVAVDASTTTLRWAVELAACSRAADDDIAHVLATVAPVIGYAGVDRAAPRLALALGYDIDIAK